MNNFLKASVKFPSFSPKLILCNPIRDVNLIFSNRCTVPLGILKLLLFVAAWISEAPSPRQGDTDSLWFPSSVETSGFWAWPKAQEDLVSLVL